MKDKEAFEKMKAYFKGEEARAIIEREIKRLEEQESGEPDVHDFINMEIDNEV